MIGLREHIDCLSGLEWKKFHYGYIVYSISKLDKPLSSIKSDLRKIKGVKERPRNIIIRLWKPEAHPL